jgi:hypothetical protein
MPAKPAKSTKPAKRAKPAKPAKRAKPAKPAKKPEPTERKYAEKLKIYFTATAIKDLRPKAGKQYLAWDGPPDKERTRGPEHATGLCVLVSPGAKSWRCCFYFRGNPRPHYLHLGRVGELLPWAEDETPRDHLNREIAEARRRTRNARAHANPGDPDNEPQDPRHDRAKSESFRAIVEAWISHVQVGELENKSALASQGVVLSNTKPWHDRPVRTIRYDEVETLLWAVRDGDDERRGRPYLANRLYAHLKPLFEWAARRSGPLKASPMAGMKKPWTKAKPRERDWFKGKAADAAIEALWRAADDLGGERGRYLKMLLITGKRPWGRANGNGIGALRWEHITADWFWDAPPSTTKTKRLHAVPLPELARRILHPRQAEGYVFGDINTDDIVRDVRRLTGIKDFIPHGIRHLVETKCAELRDADGKPLVLPHIRDMLFDHASGRGAGKDYDHHDYESEMLAAMRAWSGHIEKLVTPEGAQILA